MAAQEEDEMSTPEKAVSRKGAGRGVGRRSKAAQTMRGVRATEAKGFTTTFRVAQAPREVFDAIVDVRRWWTGEIDGSADEVGARFTYRHKGLHRSTQEVTELVPGKRITWHVSDASLSFVTDQAEWIGTDIVFEIARKGAETELRFTHVGLVPGLQCYGACSGGWTFYINGSLRRLITTGEGDPGRSGR
jgi:uncharacterized protein YndB with AHSA1/START domain